MNSIAKLGPFLIPIAGCAVGAIAIIAGVLADVAKARIKAEQRLAMIARGLSVAEIERLSASSRGDSETPKDPLRSLGNARAAAVTLTFLGIGMIFMGIGLEMVLRIRNVLACSAAGLVPFAIGIGFFVDYHLQQRDLSRFGLEVGGELPSSHRVG
jgi:hypothetical protein